VGIVELQKQGDVESLSAFDGDFGTQSIGGNDYESGVSMVVYSDESGVPELEIRTKGRFSRLTGVVGIDGNAQCLEASAKVWVADDAGNMLWGPEVVDSRSRTPVMADVSGTVRVNLEQRSKASSAEACGNGEANPAWGEVYLEGP
jgi:hypothetical protein